MLINTSKIVMVALEDSTPLIEVDLPDKHLTIRSRTSFAEIIRQLMDFEPDLEPVEISDHAVMVEGPWQIPT